MQSANDTVQQIVERIKHSFTSDNTFMNASYLNNTRKDDILNNINNFDKIVIFECCCKLGLTNDAKILMSMYPETNFFTCIDIDTIMVYCAMFDQVETIKWLYDQIKHIDTLVCNAMVFAIIGSFANADLLKQCY